MTVAQRSAVTAYVAMGANLGDATRTLHRALQALAQAPGVQVQKVSHLYRTAPVDSSGPDYFNAVVAVTTQLTAPALLAALQGIEQRFGRDRPYVNAPRTLDLDLLLYGSARIDSPSLAVPHPRMWARAFVLAPLADVAAGLVSAAALQSLAWQGIERVKASFWPLSL